MILVSRRKSSTIDRLWGEVKRYLREGHSVAESVQLAGMPRNAFDKRLQRLRQKAQQYQEELGLFERE